MFINIMFESDFNVRGSEDIVNKEDPHWPRTRHCQKHNQLSEKHHFRNRFASNFEIFATDEEKRVNGNNVTNFCLNSTYAAGTVLPDTLPHQPYVPFRLS